MGRINVFVLKRAMTDGQEILTEARQPPSKESVDPSTLVELKDFIAECKEYEEQFVKKCQTVMNISPTAELELAAVAKAEETALQHSLAFFIKLLFVLPALCNKILQFH